ncbi:aldehyde dehydrogenase (NAD) family domain protein [Mycobacterium xenopi 4042]|uniref:Aldehyde dehydrogenase (NAD) family domain protein n=1 Tax=Mycobacterium xenopi 4042 TaxID=1299334 RepID=X7ZWS0_MYCXE|nr:aldehyde dehydrogenase (NAD) family domain protein [Mycobacterium xenopi 4042]
MSARQRDRVMDYIAVGKQQGGGSRSVAARRRAANAGISSHQRFSLMLRRT